MSKATSQIEKKNWTSNFQLIGKVEVNDYTFNLDKESSKSDWIYNSLNLRVDCGEYGTNYAELMGGYGSSRNNVIYVHGKDENGKDDYSNNYPISWDDRFSEEVLADAGNTCFTTIALEKDKDDKPIIKKFLSPYDAVQYVSEVLTDGMIVNVHGNLKYSMYNGNVQARKNITSIWLSTVTETEDFKATFAQSILLDKSSVNPSVDIDGVEGSIAVHARVLDYVKEIDDKEIKGQFPFNVDFEYKFRDFNNKNTVKSVINKLFVVKKDVTQITFKGHFLSSGATVKPTLDDISDDIKALIDAGVYTEEEALDSCASAGRIINKMILDKPSIVLVGEEKTPTVQIFEKQYTEDDLTIDFDDEDSNDSEFEVIEGSSDDDDTMDWLKDL